MKKLIAAALLTVVAFSIVVSCSKKNDNPTGNYVCHCTINTAGVNTTVDLPFNGVTKSTANTNCAAAQTTYNVGSVTATCVIQ